MSWTFFDIKIYSFIIIFYVVLIILYDESSDVVSVGVSEVKMSLSITAQIKSLYEKKH